MCYRTWYRDIGSKRRICPANIPCKTDRFSTRTFTNTIRIADSVELTSPELAQTDYRGRKTRKSSRKRFILIVLAISLSGSAKLLLAKLMVSKINFESGVATTQQPRINASDMLCDQGFSWKFIIDTSWKGLSYYSFLAFQHLDKAQFV